MNKYKEIKNLKIKLLSIATALACIASGTSLSNSSKKIDAAEREHSDLVKMYIELLSEYNSINNKINKYTMGVNTGSYYDYEYNVIDSFEVNGRTINIVDDIDDNTEPTNYLSSEELLYLEDGYIPSNIPVEEELTLDFQTIDDMISFYSKVFTLNEDIINSKIYELINNDPYSWEYACMLNHVSYDNVEQAIARTIYDIAFNPESYNLSEEEINSDEYLLDQFVPEEFIYKFSTVLDVNPNLALSIACCECGRTLDSYNAINNHNFGGITGSNGYIVYPNDAEGLFRFILMLHDNYNVTHESGSDKIQRMASTYCALPDHWRSIVGGIFYELNENGYESNYYNNNYIDRDIILCENEYAENYTLIRN